MIKYFKEQIENEYNKLRTDATEFLQLKKQDFIKRFPEMAELDEKLNDLLLERAVALSNNKLKNLKTIDKDIAKLKKEKIDILIKNGYNENYLNIMYDCDECNDTGYINGCKCSCYYEKMLELYKRNSNLTDYASRNSTFENFDFKLYTNKIINKEKISSRDNIVHILEYLQECYFKSFSDNLLIFGNAASGKTFLSACIGNEMLSRGKSVVFKKSNDLISDFYSFSSKENEYKKDLLYNCDLLIIDGLGTELANDFFLKQLYYLLDYRISNNKKIVINTPLELSGITKMYTEVIASRIMGECRVIKMYSEDIRIKKNLIRTQEKLV